MTDEGAEAGDAPSGGRMKLVILLLLAASFYSWAIIVTKFLQYRRARAEAGVFDRAFWSGEPLDELFDQIGPAPDGPRLPRRISPIR